MTVTPIEGETFRFHVQSLTRPDVEHLVDFQAYWYIGKCSCEHFQYHLAPELEKFTRSTRPDPTSEEADQYRCGHLRAAWHDVSRKILCAIMAEAKTGTRSQEGW